MSTVLLPTIRGKILYYLALVYPQAVTLPLLQGELDLFGYPIPTNEILFHLAYLSEKGFVSLAEFPRGGHHPSFQVVKITAKGIDYRDGRLPQNAEVAL